MFYKKLYKYKKLSENWSFVVSQLFFVDYKIWQFWLFPLPVHQYDVPCFAGAPPPHCMPTCFVCFGTTHLWPNSPILQLLTTHPMLLPLFAHLLSPDWFCSSHASDPPALHLPLFKSWINLHLLLWWLIMCSLALEDFWSCTLGLCCLSNCVTIHQLFVIQISLILNIFTQLKYCCVCSAAQMTMTFLIDHILAQLNTRRNLSGKLNNITNARAILNSTSVLVCYLFSFPAWHGLICLVKN